MERGAFETIGQEAPHVGQREFDGGRVGADDGLVTDLTENPSELLELPALLVLDVDELFADFRDAPTWRKLYACVRSYKRSHPKHRYD